jgi:DNA-binding MarR family transcriptional regulator
MINQGEEKIRPNFWAVIPATVRYDKVVGSTAKLLFAEITALSNIEGYCWASNNYFASLFDISITQVSRLIKDLEDRGFLKSFIDNRAGNQRKLYPQITADAEVLLAEKKVKTLADRFDEQVGVVGTELSEERKSFLDYWTAKNEGGKKEHWQKQTTFAIKQRWATWIKNKRRWDKPSKPLPSDDEIRKSAIRTSKQIAEDNARKKELEEMSKPRSADEQARIDTRLTEMRKELANKFIMTK